MHLTDSDFILDYIAFKTDLFIILKMTDFCGLINSITHNLLLGKCIYKQDLHSLAYSHLDNFFDSHFKSITPNVVTP